MWTKPRVEAFNQAFQERLRAIRADPELPPISAVRVWVATDLRPSPVMVWTPAQLGAFLDHAVSDRLYALFHLIAFRGLRRGEACGARWVDLDLDERVLTVAKQLTIVGRQIAQGGPKTDSSDGVVALDTGTIAVLCIHRKRQLAEKLRCGAAWRNTGRVFTQEDGSELRPDWVSEHFERLAYAAGVPPIRLHDLRHGAATLSLAAGNDMKITSAMLRHSSLAITSDLYTAVLPDVATPRPRPAPVWCRGRPRWQRCPRLAVSLRSPLRPSFRRRRSPAEKHQVRGPKKARPAGSNLRPSDEKNDYIIVGSGSPNSCS
ncbi:site-specific integrase [Nonomuraea terrae]|uniref:site-specific integrase n=1 Tax=Nonomuraea terrae TaxID=2530383 RepID=UPI0037A794AD